MTEIPDSSLFASPLHVINVGADLLQGREVLVVVVLAALEHEVLEEMGEPGAVRLLVLRADVVPQVDGRDGDRTVDVQNDVQAVAQGVLLESDVHLDGFSLAIASNYPMPVRWSGGEEGSDVWRERHPGLKAGAPPVPKWLCGRRGVRSAPGK